MARKNEKGIQYFPMNTGIIYNTKVKLLLNEFDSDGFWIYSCILSQIYSHEGYFMSVADLDHLTLFSIDICKKKVDLVDAVIRGCVRRGLFDKHLFEKFSILTNDRIQENYMVVAERRKGGKVVKEYLLIPLQEFSKIIVVDINHENVNINSINVNISAENESGGTQSKVNKSKLNKSKLNESKVDGQIVDKNVDNPPAKKKYRIFTIPEIHDVETYFNIQKNLAPEISKKEAAKFWNFYNSKGWKVGKNKMENWISAASGWISRMDNFNKINSAAQKTKQQDKSDRFSDAKMEVLKRFQNDGDNVAI